MTRPLIFDATPLIYTIRVSLSEALRKTVGPKYVPQGVYEELLKGEILGRPEATKIRELVEEGQLTVGNGSTFARNPEAP